MTTHRLRAALLFIASTSIAYALALPAQENGQALAPTMSTSAPGSESGSAGGKGSGNPSLPFTLRVAPRAADASDLLSLDVEVFDAQVSGESVAVALDVTDDVGSVWIPEEHTVLALAQHKTGSASRTVAQGRLGIPSGLPEGYYRATVTAMLLSKSGLDTTLSRELYFELSGDVATIIEHGDWLKRSAALTPATNIPSDSMEDHQ